TDAYNQRLSMQRAESVRDALVNRYGVEANRLEAVGYGESRPVADNSTELGRAINRRVEASVEARP
ncbi:MAG: OmpA family protein, partial [Gammaproteobacteria bacterium]|nr:OmpA family protein [Gammaproteobacteria bacterium]MBU2370708.1 OmpA family protein [Gammaproteobacteria bacterium]